MRLKRFNNPQLTTESERSRTLCHLFIFLDKFL